jgi:hypothetical protein
MVSVFGNYAVKLALEIAPGGRCLRAAGASMIGTLD